MTAFLPEDGSPRAAVPVELEWFGVSTFRLRAGDTVLFLDAYLDRVPDAAPVGLASREVTAADAILVGHSHFDHLHGAQFIAAATGAVIVGSYGNGRATIDSAGGTLALAAALALRDAGEKLLSFQLLIYGVYSAEVESPSWQLFGRGALRG